MIALVREGQHGQVTTATLGAIMVLTLLGAGLVAFGGALTGKGRAQRAADLAAISAARSLRDDLPRRLSPATVNGVPNPYHLSRSAFLARAREAAARAAAANGAGSRRLRVRFPELLSPAPLMVEVRLRGEWRDRDGRHRTPTAVVARAKASLPLPQTGGSGGATTAATGGGYSGPLSVRQGRGMRPDVAAAFDRMAAVAAAAGHHLVISSAFRSDAEQAVLFAANPDPKWVAPPGTSLHRCATELDLGPTAAYGWLASNAGHFGFVLRYEWEPWHFGFEAGAPPCSAAAETTTLVKSPGGGRGVGRGQAGRNTGPGDGLLPGASALPTFVPEAIGPLILRAASRWNVSAALLAAQLQAESNFDPNVVSSAGAQGIAQFMPGTAAAYGLADPFDPAQAIMAQAHLMSDLLSQFKGSVELALAAYNAGPGAVSPCNCIPNYSETIAYVQKITALLTGSGTGFSLAPPLEVRLVH